MIIVCDVNTIWRRKPFRAMGEHRPVLGVRPRDWLVWCRNGAMEEKSESNYREQSITLPLGWASSTSALSQRWLWYQIQRVVDRPRALVVTSPHYLTLLERVPPSLPIFYYCSDDYTDYEGWGGDQIERLESRLVHRVDHAFFVSRALADRATDRYGVAGAKVSVSMNATSPMFFPPRAGQRGELPEPMPRPVIGVIGGVSNRLDFDLLQECAQLSKLGTLLLVGPLPSLPSNALETLLQHQNVRAVGRQLHEDIPRWMHGIDVALIPYRQSTFNTHCSPMRLFDHLASGRPIVATDACPQVSEFEEWIHVAASRRDFVAATAEALEMAECTEHLKGQSEAARQHTWLRRADHLGAVMDQYIFDGPVC